jgi:hypothetical protein
VAKSVTSGNGKSLVVPKNPPSDPAQDYYQLRHMGIQFLAESATQTWTDFNVADPGITMMETFIYAITDLGYRTDFPIEDLIAQAKWSEKQQKRKEFHTAGQILPSAPVTPVDFRKFLLDIDGVSNVWIDSVSNFEPCKGVKKIVVQPSNTALTTTEANDLKQRVSEAFWSARNIGETLGSVSLLQTKPIAFDLSISVVPGASPESVLATALVQINQYLQQRVQFLTFAQMLAAEKGDVAATFEGPLLWHGFLPDSQLIDKLSKVDSDALISCILDVPGLDTVVSLQITLPTPLDPVSGAVLVGPDEFPALADLDRFTFTVTQGQKLYTLNEETLSWDYEHQMNMQTLSKRAKDKHRADLDIPQGKYRHLQHYFTIQYDLPVLYNLGPDVLRNINEPVLKGPINQLKGYLVLLDQVLANYLSQLANVYQLFSWESSVKRTYFFQGLEYALQDMVNLLVGMPEVDAIGTPETLRVQLLGGLEQYRKQMAKFVETKLEFGPRRSRFLDHLLARFGRSLQTYVGQLSRSDVESWSKGYIKTAEHLLARYPKLSSKRGFGGNIPGDGARKASPPGVQRMVEALLDFPKITNGRQATYERFFETDNALLERIRIAEGDWAIYSKFSNELDLQQLLRLATHRKFYHIVEAIPFSGSGPFAIEIYANQVNLSSQAYRFDNLFATRLEAEAAILRARKLFRRFSLASERLYFIDHSLLRPLDDNPVFGLRIFDGVTTFLETQDGYYYPLNALRAIQALDDSNHEVITAPNAQGTATFQFRLSAQKDGLSFPIHPETELQLAANLGSDSLVHLSQNLTAYLRNYLQTVYGTTLGNGENIGQQLIADFLEPELPADWASGGKAEWLEQMGSAAHLEILQAWKLDPSPEANLNDALLAAMNGAAQSPTSLPSPSDKAILVELAQDFAQQVPTTDPGFADAFEAALTQWQTQIAGASLQGRTLMATLGRAAGRAILQHYLDAPNQFPERLGHYTATNLELADAPNLEENLGRNLCANLLRFYRSLPAQTTPKQFLVSLLAGDANSLIQNSATANARFLDCGLGLLNTFVRAKWQAATPQHPLLGGNVGLWWHHHSNTTFPSDSLKGKTQNQLLTHLAQGFPNGYPDFATLGAWVDAHLLTGAQPLSASALHAYALEAAGAYLQTVVAQHTEGSAPDHVADLFEALGMAVPATDQSLWKTGTVALGYFLGQLWPNGTPSAQDLGATLRQIFTDGMASSTDAVAAPLSALGGYVLGASLQNLFPAATAAGRSLPEQMTTLLSPILQDGAWGANPEGVSQTWLSFAIDGLLDPVSYSSYASLAQRLNLALYCYHRQGSTYLSQADFADIAQELQQPKALSKLGGDIKTRLRAAGMFFLKAMCQQRWHWQSEGNSALGTAVLTALGHNTSPLTSAAPSVVSPSTIDYSVELVYDALNFRVRLSGVSSFTTENAIRSAIKTLVTQTTQVRLLGQGVDKLFRAYLMPESNLGGTVFERHFADDPYSNCMSVVAPNWPIRFQSKNFLETLQEVVMNETPAQIFTQMLFLGKEKMQHFETCYANWLNAGTDKVARDYYGRILMDLILTLSRVTDTELSSL